MTKEQLTVFVARMGRDGIAVPQDSQIALAKIRPRIASLLTTDAATAAEDDAVDQENESR